jgi:ABC-type branched-subunit amino acid transport system permease subunit
MINPYWELAILLVLINIIFAQSLNLIIGYNGQFALGHAGFLAIGAYTSAVLVIHLHIPLFLAVVAASVLTAFFGLLIGYPCLRLRGDYLAIATLGFAEIIRIVLLALPSDIFGGPTGIRNAPNIKEFLPPTGSINGLMNLIFTVLFALVAVALFMWGSYAFAGFLARSMARIQFLAKRQRMLRIAFLAVLFLVIIIFIGRIGRAFLDIFQFQQAFSADSAKSTQWAVFLLYAVIAGLVLLVLRNYIRSAFGRSVIAIREDEIAASNLGINVTWVKLMNFTFGCFFAGLAGAMFAHTIPLFKPLDFNFFKSIDVLLMVVLGGMGTMGGATLGAGIITILPEVLRFVGQWRLVIYALLLVLLMIFRPTGLMGSAVASEQILRRLKGKQAAKEEVGCASD